DYYCSAWSASLSGALF
nr:immunoglobulin light chain junction region [Macaca mulatta]MOW67005.1 immunoglobulin light chain junction region [Macaca mulatta]MOW67056.1 immunoglobulin light chain junction region [Macaca mulatta]MOW67189.1 immunoglobulin light chain junction region [Macaca mulatta]MOW67305.1 immunoglobulin light chain junction region [Macaca mulatta]